MVITFTEHEKVNVMSLFPDEKNLISVKLKIYKIADFVIESTRQIANAIWILWNELYNQLRPILLDIGEKVGEFIKCLNTDDVEYSYDFKNREYKFVKTIGTVREGHVNYRPIHRTRNNC